MMQMNVTPRIFVAVPAYGGIIHHGCTLSLLRLERACRARDITIDYHMVANESLIMRARNHLVHTYLRTGYSHLLFIDADIEFEPEDILKMVDSHLPVVGGIYPKKNPLVQGGNLATDFALTLQADALPTRDRPFPVKYVGTGMMLIQRHVLESMISLGISKYRYGTEEHFAFFDTCIDTDQTYLSEDYFFCENWRRIGGTVYASWVRCTHWGTYGFKASESSLVSS
jgi:hypothetical protein